MSDAIHLPTPYTYSSAGAAGDFVSLGLHPRTFRAFRAFRVPNAPTPCNPHYSMTAPGLAA